MKNRIFLYVGWFSVSIFLFTGCAMWKKMTKKKPKPILPKMLVAPFLCDNGEIGDMITKRFVENINKNIMVMDYQQYQVYLTSRAAIKELESKSQITESVSTASAVMESKSTPVPKMLESETTGQIFSFMDRLSQDLFKSEDARTKFYQENEIDYFVIGKAKEKVLTELELGNIKTAETAEMKLLEIKTGQTLVDESFQQGYFEIVAPDRIGKKFAKRVNDKFKQMKKEVKIKKKKEKKRLVLEE